MSRALPWTGISFKIKGLSRGPAKDGSVEEAHLYYRRACLAAAEERFDIALIFCAKALGEREQCVRESEDAAEEPDFSIEVVRGWSVGVHDVAAFR